MIIPPYKEIHDLKSVTLQDIVDGKVGYRCGGDYWQSIYNRDFKDCRTSFGIKFTDQELYDNYGVGPILEKLKEQKELETKYVRCGYCDGKISADESFKLERLSEPKNAVRFVCPICGNAGTSYLFDKEVKND